MKGRTNASGGKGISTTLKVRVNGENSDNVGGTVTVKKGGAVIATGTTATGGVCSLDLGSESGSFDVAYAKGSNIAIGSVDLTPGATAILDLNISYIKYWGIIIDESNTSTSGAITYPQTLTVNGASVPNAAYGKTPAKSAANGFDMGGWANDDLIKGIKPVKSDGASSPSFTDAPTDASQWTTGTEYFTEFPFMWLSITKSSSKITVMMSNADTRPDSTFQCWAFAKANDGVSDTEIQNAASTVSRDSLMNGGSNATYSRCFRLGCFLMSGSTNGFYSKANTAATNGSLLNEYWVGANARGGQYDGMSFAQWVHIQALFLILYKDRNSQAAHSSGLTGASNKDSSNAPLSTTAYGMAGSTSSARNAFFWIHDIWGNYLQFIASVFVRAGSTLKIHHTLSRMANPANWDNNSWNSTENYALMSSKGFDTTSSGALDDSGNYYNSACGSNGAGFLVAEGATITSETTGWPDHGYVHCSSYASFPYVGGDYEDGARVGLFYAYVDNPTTFSGRASCARLSFRG